MVARKLGNESMAAVVRRCCTWAVCCELWFVVFLDSLVYMFNI